MNGIEKITARIEADAQAEIEHMLREARAEAEHRISSYQTQADTEAAELARRNESNAVEREERLVSAAQMEVRKDCLAVKQEMIEKAYELALEKLHTLPKERYTEVLTTLLLKASSTGREEVIFSPEDQKQVGKVVLEKANACGTHLTLSDETRPIRGGFILRDDRVEVNCTFETLVRLQKAETAGAVAKQLFP